MADDCPGERCRTPQRNSCAPGSKFMLSNLSYLKLNSFSTSDSSDWTCLLKAFEPLIGWGGRIEPDRFPFPPQFHSFNHCISSPRQEATQLATFVPGSPRPDPHQVNKPSAMRVSLQKDWFLNKWHATSKWSVLLVFIWIVSGLLALSIPAGKYNAKKDQYYSSYGKYIEYENQQRAYEEAQNNQNDGNNNNNYGYGYPTCKWFQWKCRKAQYYYRMQNGGGGNNNQNGNMVYTPDWYRFIGGGTRNEEDRRFYEENGISFNYDEPTGAMKFVYSWSIIMFLGLLVYGSFVILTGRSVLGLVVLCAVFAQFSLLQILLCGQGVISSDDRDLEESIYGWYGQSGVLQVYTDLGYFVFCASFCLIFAVKGLVSIVLARRGGGAGSSAKDAGADEEEAYSAPAVYKNLE